MQMLIEDGKFELITKPEEIKRQLLRIEQAGRTCYKSQKKRITYETANKFIRMVMKRGHESVIEHSYITVKFTNVSRGFTHELVRHRLASFSQESTRYVDETNSTFVAPVHRDLYEKHKVTYSYPFANMYQLYTFERMLETVEGFYRALLESGWKKEDARQILPIAITNDITVTANFREWRHIFSMRTTKPAHWEIRRLMVILLEEFKMIISVIFEDFIYSGEDANGYPYYRKLV